MAVRKKKGIVNQIPNAAVVLVVSFALLANLSILSKWHLRQLYYLFFFTLEMYLVLPQNRSSVPEIWPLNTEVISYRLVTYCIFPFTSLIIIQWGSGTFHKYCSWLSIAVKFGADGVKRTGTAHSVLSESFVFFYTCWLGLTTLVVCFRGGKTMTYIWKIQNILNVHSSRFVIYGLTGIFQVCNSSHYHLKWLYTLLLNVNQKFSLKRCTGAIQQQISFSISMTHKDRFYFCPQSFFLKLFFNWTTTISEFTDWTDNFCFFPPTSDSECEPSLPALRCSKHLHDFSQEQLSKTCCNSSLLSQFRTKFIIIFFLWINRQHLDSSKTWSERGGNVCVCVCVSLHTPPAVYLCVLHCFKVVDHPSPLVWSREPDSRSGTI